MAGLFVAHGPAVGDTPRRGGILEFAVDAEPPNYDCHANASFALLHPVAPHYSTLLKFDTANYPQVVGDLAESWTVSPDKLTFAFKLRPNVLFHDGSRLTSEDVKASWERIVRPPAGVTSVRRVNYSAIGVIDTPDPLTVVFHLKWPEAAMLQNYRADFVTGAKMIQGFRDGRIMAEFRFISPNERDDLLEALGNELAIYESPTLLNLLIVFNTKHPPYDDARVRRALSLAIDRWGGAEALSRATVLKFVGGLLRPGFGMATPEAELAGIPGYWRDVVASRAEAERLLAEAGAADLTVKLTNRDLPMPWVPGGQLRGRGVACDQPYRRPTAVELAGLDDGARTSEFRRCNRFHWRLFRRPDLAN